MRSPIRILYIPGLGDRYDSFRRFTLMFWKLLGANAQLVSMNWYSSEPLEEKLMRVKQAVRGQTVIIGESAGATIALLAASESTDIKKVITICGVTRSSTPISPNLQQKAPALSVAVRELADVSLPANLPIHSIRSIYDPVVGKRYSIAKHATAHVIWTIGHLFTIVCCLTVLSWYVIRLARNRAPSVEVVQ